MLSLTVVCYVLSWIGTEKINPEQYDCISQIDLKDLLNLDENLSKIMGCFLVAQAGPPTDAWKIVLGVFCLIFYVINILVSVLSLRLRFKYKF